MKSVYNTGSAATPSAELAEQELFFYAAPPPLIKVSGILLNNNKNTKMIIQNSKKKKKKKGEDRCGRPMLRPNHLNPQGRGRGMGRELH